MDENDHKPLSTLSFASSLLKREVHCLLFALILCDHHCHEASQLSRTGYMNELHEDLWLAVSEQRLGEGGWRNCEPKKSSPWTFFPLALLINVNLKYGDMNCTNPQYVLISILIWNWFMTHENIFFFQTHIFWNLFLNVTCQEARAIEWWRFMKNRILSIWRSTLYQRLIRNCQKFRFVILFHR